MASEGRNNLVGIDLGTTMSVIARLDSQGLPTTITNEANDPLTPSVIFLDGTTALVGREARDAGLFDSSKLAAFMKREMGLPVYSRMVDGRQFRPETLSAIVLRKLKNDAERKIGPISKAVITVPAYFDETRRKSTEDAGRIAGLVVHDIINEPTAAALSYAMLSQRQSGDVGPVFEIPGGEMTAVVYDLGGGTFDVTVVRLQSKRFETLATDGDTKLGGKDWDDQIVNFLAQEFKKKYRQDPCEDDHSRDTLAVAAERTKILLSRLSQVSAECSYGGKTLRTTLTRGQFEEMCSKLLMQTRMTTDLVVRKQAGLRWDDIDCVLLVGGSTRMPMVKTMLQNLTGKQPNNTLDADQVVAHGAAIHAGIIASKAGEGQLDEEVERQFEDVTEVNVNSHSLGVEARKKGAPVNSILIPKNTQLPFAGSRIYYLHDAGATSIEVNVLEGDAAEPKYDIEIGKCCVTGLPEGLPKGAPVQVRLACDANGRVNVKALDMTYGRFAQAVIDRRNGLNDDDIRREAEFVSSLDLCYRS